MHIEGTKQYNLFMEKKYPVNTQNFENFVTMNLNKMKFVIKTTEYGYSKYTVYVNRNS